MAFSDYDKPTGFTTEGSYTNFSSVSTAKRIASVPKFLEYMQSNYGLVFSKEMVQDVFKTFNTDSYANPTIFTLTEVPKVAVKAAIRICNQWKKYLSNPDDFDRLVCNQLVSMSVAHSCVFSTYFCTKAGISLNFNPGTTYAVIVDLKGKVREIR